jgi:hypothetical protein
MDDNAKLLKDVLRSFDNVVKKHRKASKDVDECIAACAATYDQCVGNASSDAERAACAIAYDRCVQRC